MRIGHSPLIIPKETQPLEKDAADSKPSTGDAAPSEEDSAAADSQEARRPLFMDISDCAAGLASSISAVTVPAPFGSDVTHGACNLVGTSIGALVG